jgi:YEATS domain-containing protein 4
VTVYRAIVYGNSATPLTHVKNPPEVVPEGHTHQWTVSVRGPGNSDISHFVKKVVFKLHESFASPTRCTSQTRSPEHGPQKPCAAVLMLFVGGVFNVLAIEEPPFEVTETGWGEFEIQIKIFFQPEASEKPLTLFHFLHLHPYGPNKDEEKEQGTTIEAHQYDEVVCLTTINFELRLCLVLIAGIWRSYGNIL